MVRKDEGNREDQIFPHSGANCPRARAMHARPRAASGGELMLLWYFVNQQFSEVSSPLTPHFEIQQFSECSRRSLLPNLPCEYRLELSKLPWQRARLLSPVPNSLNRPDFHHCSMHSLIFFTSMEGTRSAHRLHA